MIKYFKRGDMKIHSTRSFKEVSQASAILNGLSEDGGLYVWDAIDPYFFNDSFYDKTFEEVSTHFFKTFLSDFNDSHIQNMVSIIQSDLFQPDYLTFTHLKEVSLLNVFHGPSFSFKDMALSILPEMIRSAKEILGIKKKTVILTATSGDTGGAALEGFKHQEDTTVIVLYPKHNISVFQERQMLSYQSDKAFVLGVDGDFDTCQKIVKEILLEASEDTYLLSSANSINIGRIIAQIHYYIQSYLRLVSEKKINKNQPIDIVVPSGNFGNIYAAFVAKKLGVPIGTLGVASNANNVLSRLINTKIYVRNGHLNKTLTPAMDILVSSNLERWFYDFTKDPQIVKNIMSEFYETGTFDLTPYLNLTDFKAYEVSDEETIQTIREVFNKSNHLIDPHTAVGVFAARHMELNNPVVCVATASPYKFIETISKALDLDGNSLDLLKKSHAYDSRMDLVNKTMDPKILYTRQTVKEKIMKVLEAL